ncbi:MAG: hypothetical protein ACI8Z9_001234 [Paraglaciecola sp.]|jgi:hypothetical protein
MDLFYDSVTDEGKLRNRCNELTCLCSRSAARAVWEFELGKALSNKRDQALADALADTTAGKVSKGEIRYSRKKAFGMPAITNAQSALPSIGKIKRHFL